MKTTNVILAIAIIGVVLPIAGVQGEVDSAGERRQTELFDLEIKLLEEEVERKERQHERGVVGALEYFETKRDLLAVRREKAVFQGELERQRALLKQEMQVIQDQLERVKAARQAGREIGDAVALRRDLLALQRELVGVESKLVPAAGDNAGEATGQALSERRSHEYKVIEINLRAEEVQDTLNHWARRGWELVSIPVMAPQDFDSDAPALLILRRSTPW